MFSEISLPVPSQQMMIFRFAVSVVSVIPQPPRFASLSTTGCSVRVVRARGQFGAGATSSLRGALATKQSILSLRGGMDCFASLAMTEVRMTGHEFFAAHLRDPAARSARGF